MSVTSWQDLRGAFYYAAIDRYHKAMPYVPSEHFFAPLSYGVGLPRYDMRLWGSHLQYFYTIRSLLERLLFLWQ